ISSILEFSEARNPSGLKRIVCLSECIEAAVSGLEQIVGDNHVEIEIQPIGHEVEAVVIKIHQLFQNLIGNAIKYHSQDRSTHIKLYELIDSENKRYQIIVEDNGIGFSEDHAADIFKPFHRLHSKDDYEGSGIGLATCRCICEFHGWDIHAESMDGQGSKFIVSMPL
ncbi:MAG: histidine kinase, partial [Planctomycetes bacterium]|nr:histidine kinase [Planctomycetota bacterium]